MAKKNCTNCEYLEWAFGDTNDTEGFCCNKRDYFKSGNWVDNESKHLGQLESKEYRDRPKKCHEPRVGKMEVKRYG